MLFYSLERDLSLISLGDFSSFQDVPNTPCRLFVFDDEDLKFLKEDILALNLLKKSNDFIFKFSKSSLSLTVFSENTLPKDDLFYYFQGIPLFEKLKGIFYMHHPTNRIAYTMAFVIPVTLHWLEHKMAQCVHHE